MLCGGAAAGDSLSALRGEHAPACPRVTHGRNVFEAWRTRQALDGSGQHRAAAQHTCGRVGRLAGVGPATSTSTARRSPPPGGMVDLVPWWAAKRTTPALDTGTGLAAVSPKPTVGCGTCAPRRAAVPEQLVC